MSAKDKLIVALDVDRLDKAMELVDILSPEVEVFKVGVAPFTDFGEALLEKIKSCKKKVFLDLKFHDIPNTVRSAARAAAKKGVYMMNFHCLGGEDMLKAAVEGAEEAGVREKPILLGVTILTSMNEKDVMAIGLGGNLKEKVIANPSWMASHGKLGRRT